MSRYHTIPIEVPAHIAEYFKVRTRGRVKVGRQSLIGNLIYFSLKPLPVHIKLTKKDPRKHYVDLVIHKFYSSRRMYLEKKDIPMVVNMLRNVFIEDFETEVDKNHFYWGHTIKESIELFLDKYRVSPDNWSYQTARKHYQRYRKKGNRLRLSL